MTDQNKSGTKKRRASRTAVSSYKSKPAASQSSSAGKKKKKTSPQKTKPKTPRTKKPENMGLEEWQRTLRREFGEVQDFKMENIGTETFFSEFMIENPDTGGKYRVAIRGERPGDNYCSCPDFAVNTLGTCKHIEFTLTKLRKKRGAKKAFKQGFHPPYSSVFLRYGMKREVVFRKGTEIPSRLNALADKYFDENCVLRPESFFSFDEFLKQASKIDHELRCYEDALDYIARVRDQRSLREKIDKAFSKGEESKAFQNLLKIPLYNYQKKGALFAARAGRSILADEMGLGKTIQAIAAVEILARLAGVERVLVICPASLKHQWQDEIERFSGRSCSVVEGGVLKRRQIYDSECFYKLLNYELVHRDEENIKRWSPDMIILDEAQRIKNWKTRTAQHVKKLDSQYAIVLTGTPLENRLEELHSVTEFVDRFHLGPRFRFLHEHQLTDEAGMIVGYKNLASVSGTLSPILIRRSKSEVLEELPERLEKKYFVEMTSQQKQHHEENRETVARLVAKWRRFHFLSETEQRIMMNCLQNMRMSCNSTYLLDKETDHGLKTDELMSLLSDVFEDPDAKAVVFSQWLGTHELIIRRLQDKGWDYSYLHGGVPSPKRKELVRRFREEPDCRLFLSTEAGGVGMNLQSASVVINMDLPWNPAVLEQRIGRVHRLGQHRPVRVVNFIAENTIEHGMLSLLNFKKSLFSGVLDGGQDEVFLGGSRLKRFMESVEKVSDNIPEGASITARPPVEEATKEQAASGPAAEAAPSPSEQAWMDVANAGLALVNKLFQALDTEGRNEDQKEQQQAFKMPDVKDMIERDEAGRSYFKFPMPEPQSLKKIADLLYKMSGE